MLDLQQQAPTFCIHSITLSIHVRIYSTMLQGDFIVPHYNITVSWCHTSESSRIRLTAGFTRHSVTRDLHVVSASTLVSTGHWETKLFTPTISHVTATVGVTCQSKYSCQSTKQSSLDVAAWLILTKRKPRNLLIN